MVYITLPKLLIILQVFAMRSLLVAALICVISGHAVFTNVAYSRPVALSSNYPYGSFPGSNAVNGLLSDLAHTSLEKSPWLRIDLGARFLIHEIEVFARSDHLGKH